MESVSGSAGRRLLVTGASGFIGRHTLLHLEREGFEVHAVSRTPAAGASAAETSRASATWHAADLLRSGTPTELVRSVCPTHLLHLAWEATPGRFWQSPDNERWQVASSELLRAFLAQGGRRVVMTGSGAEYDWRAGRCDEASTPIRPVTPYSRSKDALRRELERSCRAGAEGAGASWAWARLFWQFGPGEPEGRLVPSVIGALLEGREAECSSGVQRRDFLYVDDVGRALAMLVASDVQGCINIASGRAITIALLARSIAAAMGAPGAIRLGALAGAAEEPPLVEAVTLRLREELGFRPSWPLDRAIEATIEARRAAEARRTDEARRATEAERTDEARPAARARRETSQS